MLTAQTYRITLYIFFLLLTFLFFSPTTLVECFPIFLFFAFLFPFSLSLIKVFSSIQFLFFAFSRRSLQFRMFFKNKITYIMLLVFYNKIVHRMLLLSIITFIINNRKTNVDVGCLFLHLLYFVFSLPLLPLNAALAPPKREAPGHTHNAHNCTKNG